MPKRFTFQGPERPPFTCVLKTKHCSEITKKGERCKRLCVTPFEYCPIHLEKMKLKIKDSDLGPHAGKGLFAYDRKANNNAIIFRRDDIITPYIGHIVNNRYLDEKYGPNVTAPYAYCHGSRPRSRCTDGACRRGVGAFVNHSSIRNKINAMVTYDTTKKEFIVFATKIIRNNQEIYIDYGNDYIIDEPDVNFTTKPYYPKK